MILRANSFEQTKTPVTVTCKFAGKKGVRYWRTDMHTPFYFCFCSRPYISILTCAVGRSEDLTSGEGSTQMSPNHSFDVQVVELAVDDRRVDEEICIDVDVGSLHPPNQPG